jgi:Bifunctional DNA primase/polymerase, N-terminal
VRGVNVLDFALAYRELGFAVLPLKPRDKRPHTRLIQLTRRSSSWARLREQAATSAEISEWFRREPEANLGIITGAASLGVVVADYDTGRPERLRETPIVATGRGLHVYARSDPPTATEKRDGFELKADGGYVVAPPSIHPSGEMYRWLIAPVGLGHLFLPEATPIALEALGLGAPLAGRHGLGPSSDPFLLDVPTGVPTQVPTRFRSGGLGFLEGFDADPEAVAAMCKALGIPHWDGEPFHCVLHEEKKPSASVFQFEDGTHHYHDWHAKPEWLTFAQVRAGLSGRPGARGPELATWKLILLAEAGVLTAQPIDAPELSDSATDLARHLYERLLFVLGCRWNYSPGEPMPFSQRFGAAVCGLSPAQVWRAMRELERLGVIEIVGSTGEGRRATCLWLPAGVEAPQRDSSSLEEPLRRLRAAVPVTRDWRK